MKVLVAEDDRAFRTLLCDLVAGWGYEVVSAADCKTAREILEAEDRPRLAILDWTTPGIDAVDLCRAVRADGSAHYVYILILTARALSEDLVIGMESGADDYVTKPFDSDELRARLFAGRRIVELHEQLVQAREALREQATRDGLTGVWNRSTILQLLEDEIVRARRQHTPVGVVMADLDYFKKINDTCGHITGDQVLRESAQRMRSQVRQYDAVGRYGGEEFLVVLPGCDLQGGVAQADRLLAAFRNQPFILPDSAVSVTCSFGVAALDCSGPMDADQLVREADAALYLAKRKGRNCVGVLNGGLLEWAVPEEFLSPAGPAAPSPVRNGNPDSSEG